MIQRLYSILLASSLACLLHAQVDKKELEAHSPITLTGISNHVIDGLKIINSSGPCITITNCSNIIVRNCHLGPSAGEGVNIYGSNNITIEQCSFEANSTGVYALQSTRVSVTGSQFEDPRGPMPRGQYVQLNQVYGEGNRISYNIGESTLERGDPEDLISLFQCFASATDPIQIIGNKLRGGGPSDAGGGIMTGDGGGSQAIVANNVLVDPGQYGIANSGGDNISICNNKVYGREQYFTNVGIYAHDFAGSGLDVAGTHVSRNRVNWIDGRILLPDGTTNPHRGCQNPFWFEPGLTVQFPNMFRDQTLNSTILPTYLLSPELVARFNFDNNYDDSSGSLHSLTGNQIHLISDGNNLAAYFDGSNSLASIANSSELTPDKFTASVWVRADETNQFKCIAKSACGNGWDSGWRLAIDGQSFTPLLVTTTGRHTLTCGQINSNQWTNLVLSYDGKTMRAYVDGKLEGAEEVQGDIVYGSSDDMWLGLSYGAPSYHFKGSMDEYSFYRGVLSPAAISEEYYTSLLKFRSNGWTSATELNLRLNGDVSDATGNHTGGTNTDSSFVYDGQRKSADFNGSTSQLEIPSSGALTAQTFTISMWVKPRQLEGVKCLAKSAHANGWDHGWRLAINDGYFTPLIVTQSGRYSLNPSSHSLLKADKWNYLTVSYDGTTFCAYVDGQLAASCTAPGPVLYGSPDALWLGNSYGDPSYHFNGLIDDFTYSYGVQDGAEIARLYNNCVEFYR